jgi:hypothetical protein
MGKTVKIEIEEEISSSAKKIFTSSTQILDTKIGIVRPTPLKIESLHQSSFFEYCLLV